MSSRRRFLQSSLLTAGALALPRSGIAAAAAHDFGWKGEDFLLDGKPFVIRGGEMHYSRVPPGQWRARLRMLRAMGLNAIGTYVFWNLHEPRPGADPVPAAEWLRRGDNEMLVLELERGVHGGSVRGLTEPVFAIP